MSYSDAEEIYLNAVAVATAAANQAAFNTRNKRSGSIAVIWSGASATDATFKLQESWDGSTWSDVASGSATLNAASGQTKISFRAETAPILDAPMLRGVVTKNSETTALLTVRYYLRGNH